MFRNTTASVPTLDKYDLVEGNYYLIQHGKEGLKGVTKYAPGTTTEVKDKIVAQTITRFKGRFIRYDIGRSSRYPDGLPGYLTPGREVAVFDQVKKISGDDKRFFTDDVYVIKPSRGIMTTFDAARITSNGMLQEITNPANQTAFATGTWTFANDTLRNNADRLADTTLHGLANTPMDPNLTEEENNLIALRGTAMSTDGVGDKISEYLGRKMPNVIPYKDLHKDFVANDPYNYKGNKVNLDEPYSEVDGGSQRRKNRTRRNKTRKARRNKTSSRKRKNTKRYRK